MNEIFKLKIFIDIHCAIRREQNDIRQNDIPEKVGLFRLEHQFYGTASLNVLGRLIQ